MCVPHSPPHPHEHSSSSAQGLHELICEGHLCRGNPRGQGSALARQKSVCAGYEQACVSVHWAWKRGVYECDTGHCQACLCAASIYKAPQTTRSRQPPVPSVLTSPSTSTPIEPLLYTASSSQCQGEQLHSSSPSWAFADAFGSNFSGKVSPPQPHSTFFIFGLTLLLPPITSDLLPFFPTSLVSLLTFSLLVIIFFSLYYFLPIYLVQLCSWLSFMLFHLIISLHIFLQFYCLIIKNYFLKLIQYYI